MAVIKEKAEFCTLLVDELYGQLPARVYATLFQRGKLSIRLISQFSKLNARQVKNGLCVLQQHNLLFYTVDANSGEAEYSVNHDYAYNLVRTGKILEMVDNSYGPAGRDVMQNLLLLGQTRISDLVAAYQAKINLANSDDAWLNDKKPELVIKSKAQLNSVLCRLIEAELIDVVHSKTFQSAHEIEKQVHKEVMDFYFPNGIKGTKAKVEFEQKVAEGLRKVREESKTLKRKLAQNGGASKRRKLAVGNETNGVPEEEEDLDPALDPRQVIRINYEKCIVELRSRRLVQYVNETLGETTGYVYGQLLKQLTKNTPRCRPDPLMDTLTPEGEKETPSVTTNEILDKVKTSIDLTLGIGKIPSKAISKSAAERLTPFAPKDKIPFMNQDDSDDDEEDGDYSDSDEEMDTKKENGDASVARMSRPEQLRQHLLLLAEGHPGFVRHCGEDEWTIDFKPLMENLRATELDSIIEQTSGRQGLRLTRILRTKGKLGEQALQSLSLMRKVDLQQKMLEMRLAGFAHTQEVPRDNKADPKKSIFLWYCDTEQAYSGLIAKCYATMVHCLQVLEVRRQKEKDVLSLAKRTNVKGKEKDMMRDESYARFAKFLKDEKLLMAEIMRIDDTLALLQDF
ncbi:RNA polymerase III subunit RPC82-domain-containing protein [Neurospora tetraspora]|uniref:DNA-directed RNA polymerase III subunit RPC3 n=1 Tax=Neurospora tetraspora TaxID=94610 RepID=A0AAE0JEN5_9PEZI|nr:RNA polymerase III subunit RPC82-domain-containing protein [Neurospora tetraspora]